MSIELPPLLASASGLLLEPLASLTGKGPFGDSYMLWMLLAVAASIAILIVLVRHQLRASRIAAAADEAAPEDLTRLMRESIEQLNGIATTLQTIEQQPACSAAATVIAGQLDPLAESAFRTAAPPLASEPRGVRAEAIAQLAAKVDKLSELASRMRAEEQALKRNALGPDGPAQNSHYLEFSLGDEHFALSIRHIHSVVNAVQLVAEPSMPPKIRKAIRLQDALIPVIDFGARFAGQPVELGRNSRIVILEVPSGARLQLIGALVDSVGEVLELSPIHLESQAASGSRIRAPFTHRTLMLDDRAVTLLDISREFSTNELTPHQAKQENHFV
nr:chemotaxis protein CheW [uncultured Pseudomonas sp.]